jgi:Domain of unknown function (DUF6458)
MVVASRGFGLRPEPGSPGYMSIGAALFMIAVGAILRYAVSDSIEGVDLPVIGLILMIVGVVGLLISLFMYANASRRADVVERDRYVERDPRL